MEDGGASFSVFGLVQGLIGEREKSSGSVHRIALRGVLDRAADAGGDADLAASGSDDRLADATAKTRNRLVYVTFGRALQEDHELSTVVAGDHIRFADIVQEHAAAVRRTESPA